MKREKQEEKCHEMNDEYPLMIRKGIFLRSI